jgi:hypothetical protein
MSELNHYLLDVTVTDAVFGSSESIKSDMKVAALGRDQNDVAELVIDFFTRSGLAVKEHNGIHTLYRTEAKTGPGSIRTVKINSCVTYVSPTSLPSTAAETTAPKNSRKKAAAAEPAPATVAPQEISAIPEAPASAAPAEPETAATTEAPAEAAA